MKFLPKWLVRLLDSAGLLKTIFKTLKLTGEESLCDTLKKITTNKELQAVLAYNFSDFGMIDYTLCINFKWLVSYLTMIT